MYFHILTDILAIMLVLMLLVEYLIGHSVRSCYVQRRRYELCRKVEAKQTDTTLILLGVSI